MMPNIDPKALKAMMNKMGIKSSEIPASRVVIEGAEKDIIIENPQVVSIEAQGTLSFQISGDVREQEKNESFEISEDDIKTVQDQTGITDIDLIKAALEESKGDIAAAIMSLKQ
ncbi:MAG: nascent polypeptide-associated complex protein [Candidatus Micrarchaeota archaeon]|nr:nascent polypeptide-associated complex protein [Candidatus Micrarchaeota archaeon]